jgi:hypothetical protein
VKSANLSFFWEVISRFDGLRFEAGMSFWWRKSIARDNWKKSENESCSDRAMSDEKEMWLESAYSVSQ